MNTKNETYFDLFVTGVGYVTSVFDVSITGKTVTRVCITALRGRSGSPKETKFRVDVSGTQALEWINILRRDVDEGRKVLIRFRMSELESPRNSFTNDDSTMLHLPARLIGVDWARVDGAVVQPSREINQTQIQE